MNRVGLIPERQVASEIDALHREAEKLKGVQFNGGEGLVLRYTETSGTWDIDETLTVTGVARWRVTFTPEATTRPFAQICFSWDVNSGFDESSNIDVYTDPANIEGNTVSFLLEFRNLNFDPVIFKAKFGIKSVDGGTLTFLRLADL